MPTSTSFIPVITIIPIHTDNFCYLVTYAPNKALLVDPAEPKKIFPRIPANLIITHILTTHKHWDHAGGNFVMLQLCFQKNENQKVVVVGGEVDKVEGSSLPVADEQVIDVDGLRITCMLTPGHTQGHICYFCESSTSPPFVFTGDCLFVGGCGRLFEGSPDDMTMSMLKLSKLPLDTLVYCGHEYTKSNLTFAISVEPSNKAIATKLTWVQDTLSNNGHTVPSTIASEIETNVFVRAAMNISPELCSNLNCTSGNAAELLGLIRKAKDCFKPK